MLLDVSLKMLQKGKFQNLRTWHLVVTAAVLFLNVYMRKNKMCPELMHTSPFLLPA